MIKDKENLLKLPNGWICTTLGEVADLISGQHILNEDYCNEPIGLPYLTGPADFSTKHPIITKWTTKPKVSALKNDVLITVKGAGVGKVNILDINEAAIGRQLMAVRGMPIDANYYFFFFQT